nr:unnamed protein product [Callosobruchus analis]
MLEMFRASGLKKSLFLAASVNCIQQLVCTRTAVLGYLTPIFISAGISPDIVSLMACLVQLLTTIIAAMLVDKLGFCIGMGVVPMILASEVLPNEVKSIGMSITVSCAGLTASLIVFRFPGTSQLPCPLQSMGHA